MTISLMLILGLAMTSTADTHMEELCRLVQDSRPPKLRTIRAFSEEEIWLPDSGPHAGEKFKCAFQPYSLLWFDAVASNQFNRFVATGPSQSGKTLSALVIPLLYHLFERRETCILAAPKIEIAFDKWLVDVLPVIQRSRYAHLLPTRGGASQGGFSETITFRNGVRLKFMSGGGSDASKAAFPAKNCFVTEVDGIKSSELSNESDPINQLAARLRAFGQFARIYLECTVTTKRGRIWRELLAWTCSQIVLQCCHCLEWTTPERDDFVGWDTAATELQAESLGRFSCSRCGGLWTPEYRIEANRNAKLIHRGQQINQAGEVSGPVPETRTFSLRWSAVNNLFATEAQLASEEFKAERDEDQESAQKARCQQVWTIPWQSSIETSSLTPEGVASRLSGIPHRVLPNDTETLVATADVHNAMIVWNVVATGPKSAHSVVDYGITLCPNPETNGTLHAVRLGLRLLHAELSSRDWKTEGGRSFPIDLVLADSGYFSDVVVECVTKFGLPWRCSKGIGDTYKRPDEGDGLFVADNWHIARQPACEASLDKPWWLTLLPTNHWLHVLQSGFAATPFLEDGTRRPNSIALFGTDYKVHTTAIDNTIARSNYATQICAWRWGEVETKKHGRQMAWISEFGQDHFSDCLTYALVGDRVVRVCHPRFKATPPPAPEPIRSEPLNDRQRRIAAGVADYIERMQHRSEY